MTEVPADGGRPRRVMRRVVTGVLVLVLLFVAALGALYLRLQSNITSKDVNRWLGDDRPTEAPAQGSSTPVTILVMGSDTRKGNREEGLESYGKPRSDTTILLHVAADRKSAIGVSIPRDSVVDIPTCTRPDGTHVPARPRTMFNVSFGDGPACTYRTVEQLTGIRIDHYVVVDFRGFKSMVDALHGVPVCLSEDVDDPQAHLKLSAGRHLLDGDQSLGFVRSRHGFGDGSDLGRINRQQTFLSSMVQKATTTKTLVNPVALVKFLDAGTKALTVDPGLGDLNSLRSLAQSVARVPTRDITFLTIPNEPYPPDHNRVQWKQPAADDVWSAIRSGQPVPGTPGYLVAHAKDAPLTLRPPQVRVRVVNASGTEGVGTQAARELRARGFVVTAVRSGPASATTLVRHDATRTDAALTLEAALDKATDEVSTDAGVELVVGADFDRTVPIAAARFPKAPGNVVMPPARTADEDICA